VYSVNLLSARRYASAGTSYGPVSVCVCLCHKSVLLKWLDGLSWFLAWRLLSASPTLRYKEINSDVYKNKGISFCNFFLNYGLRKFRHGISIVERAINLARERWTLRAW